MLACALDMVILAEILNLEGLRAWCASLACMPYAPPSLSERTSGGAGCGTHLAAIHMHLQVGALIVLPLSYVVVHLELGPVFS